MENAVLLMQKGCIFIHRDNFLRLPLIVIFLENGGAGG